MWWILETVVAAAPVVAPCASDLGPPAVYLLTFSPGSSVHSAFGHTALLVWDPPLGDGSRVYDFGHFDASDPVALGWGIATNHQDYHVGRQSLRQMMRTYGALGRGIVAQELALGPDQARALADSLEDTLATEASFPYNWYRPNCTTRIGDLLDQTLDGRLAPQHQGPSGTSKARQVLRHSANVPWLWFGLHWGSGHVADRELTDWEAAFLPITLMERVAVSENDGRPLVASTCEMLPNRLPPMPDAAPNRDPWLVGIGLGVAGGLVGGSLLDRRLGWLLVGVVGAVAGLFGTAALLAGVLGTFAPSWGAHNLAFGSPLDLGLVVAAVVAWRHPAHRLPLRIAAGVLAVAAVGVGIALVRGFGDRNLGIVGGMVPVGLAAAWVLRPRLD